MPEGHYYVVRGATMACACGSHKRRINLSASHGSYAGGKPMMNDTDCQPFDNIPYFGTCNSGENPNHTIIHLVGEHGEIASGKPCVPTFFNQWMMTKADTLVEGRAALTTESQLVCAYGGIITFASNGQNGD